ncbi:MAG: hypothetical protein ABSH08_07975 [Tepidisphaeraceae bacterium]
MKRFRRWVFNLLAGMSLILFLAAAPLWVRSYTKAEDFLYFGSARCAAVHTVRGRIAFVCTNAMWSNPHFEYSSWTKLPSFDVADPPRGPHTIWNHLGFFFKRNTRLRGSTSQDNNLDPGMSLPPVVSFTELVLPFWVLLLLLALPPFWNFVLPLLFGIHRPPGHCPKCGYDLRATPDRCPECGTVPPKKEMVSN